jgi:membrane protease YdiL (CAAX protease family)
MMTTTVLPEFGLVRPAAVAPWRHTAILIAFFFLLAGGGAVLQHRARTGGDLTEQRPNLPVLYLSLIAGEWGLIYYVWKGAIRPSGITLRQFIGGRWNSGRAVGLDVILACGLFALWQGISFLWERWLGPGHAAAISPMLPRGITEGTLWVLVSISAGVSEELVFRGYLQRQLTALTGRTSLALLLQGTIFGIAHGYQGARNCLAIALYGALFTMLALWRKSLRPGMIAHAFTDIVAAFWVGERESP